MRRDIRLHGLSSDHQRALALAHRVKAALEQGEPTEHLAHDVGQRFTRELRPHFDVEERILLPALQSAGEPGLVERTRREHEELGARLEAALAGDRAALARFAELLEQHVRFEERELFPVCEERVDAGVLEEVARVAPKGR